MVGCGYWGKNIGRVLAQMGALASVTDDDRVRAATYADEHGVSAAAFDEVLADPTVDAVAIATPASTHHELSMAALRAGKDVFVEKPMALRPAHGAEMTAFAQREGRILMVGHLLQYHAAFERLKDLVGSGQLGRLQYLYSTRLNYGKIRREEDVLWSFAPHDLSMVLSLAGEEPTEVRAEGRFLLHGRIADVTTTHLTFASGLAGHVFVSWLHPMKEQRLVVIGERGMAIFDDRQPLERKLSLYQTQVEWLDGQPVAPKAEPYYLEIAETEPLRNELEHFTACVRDRSQPRTDGAEGQRVLNVLTKATDQILADRPSPTGPTGLGVDVRDGGSLDLREPAASDHREGVHPTAVVDDDVKIGPGTRVWHFSHLLTNTTVGANCSLGQNVVAGPNVQIGDGVRIQNNVSVFEGVTLEDDVFCGPSMVFTNVRNPRAFVSRKDEFAPTLVRRGASIGANATVVCGSTIGEYAFVAAGAVVTADVEPYALMVGVPARRIGWVSREGEVLGDDLTCPRTGEAYELIDGSLRPRSAGNDPEPIGSNDTSDHDQTARA